MTKQEMLDKVHNLLRDNNRFTKIHRQFAVNANGYDIVAIGKDITGYTAVDIDSHYEQLQEQILIQDRYFDYNYAVIEAKHAKLSNYVPSYWGIILVGNQAEITHAASNNKHANLSSQLEMLTMEELHRYLLIFMSFCLLAVLCPNIIFTRAECDPDYYVVRV